MLLFLFNLRLGHNNYNTIIISLKNLIKNLKNLKLKKIIRFKKKKFTILRAPFVHKVSQEQFEYTYYFVDIIFCFKYNLNRIIFLEFLLKNSLQLINFVKITKSSFKFSIW